MASACSQPAVISSAPWTSVASCQSTTAMVPVHCKSAVAMVPAHYKSAVAMAPAHCKSAHSKSAVAMAPSHCKSAVAMVTAHYKSAADMAPAHRKSAAAAVPTPNISSVSLAPVSNESTSIASTPSQRAVTMASALCISATVTMVPAQSPGCACPTQRPQRALPWRAALPIQGLSRIPTITTPASLGPAMVTAWQWQGSVNPTATGHALGSQPQPWQCFRKFWYVFPNVWP